MKSYKVKHISPLKIAWFVIICLKGAAYSTISCNMDIDLLHCLVLLLLTELLIYSSELSAFSVSAVGMQTAAMIHCMHKRKYLQLAALYW